jgi:hypothetical protein
MLASRHAAQRVLVEDAGAGTSLVQELLGEVDGILACPASDDLRQFGWVASTDVV